MFEEVEDWLMVEPVGLDLFAAGRQLVGAIGKESGIPTAIILGPLTRKFSVVVEVVRRSSKDPQVFFLFRAAMSLSLEICGLWFAQERCTVIRPQTLELSRMLN